MSRTTKNQNENQNVIAEPMLDEQKTFAVVEGFHVTPKGYVVLEFAEAEVPTPINADGSGYRPRRRLSVGDTIIAYWLDRMAEDGTQFRQFVLRWEDEGEL